MRFTGRLRRTPVGVVVAPGEKVLATAPAGDGVVAGTRDALYLPDATRVPWHLVETADWDLEAEVLTVREVGTFGEVKPEHRLSLTEPGRLLQLVRERVTASVVLTRHFALVDKQGVKVIGRRATTAARELAWYVEYDPGIDPDDPAVVTAVADALAVSRAEVGAS